MTTYDVGDSIRLNAEFTVTGTLADPNIITLSTRDPSGNVDVYNFTSGTVSKESTGKYFRDVFVDEPGQWWYEFFGTGTVISAEENYFLVDRSLIP